MRWYDIAGITVLNVLGGLAAWRHLPWPATVLCLGAAAARLLIASRDLRWEVADLILRVVFWHDAHNRDHNQLARLQRQEADRKTMEAITHE